MVELVEIDEFLRTGKFGKIPEINFGMLRMNLIEILGETEWIHFTGRKSKFPSIYKYDKVEFYFEEGEKGRLHGIQLKPTTVKGDLGKLKIDYGILDESLLFSDISNKLNNSKISWKEHKQEFDDEEVYRIMTIGGVQLIFTKNYNGELELEQASKFITYRSDKPKTKQISITILEEDYNNLRSIASREKVSISKYCSEVITKNINANKGTL